MTDNALNGTEVVALGLLSCGLRLLVLCQIVKLVHVQKNEEYLMLVVHLILMLNSLFSLLLASSSS